MKPENPKEDAERRTRTDTGSTSEEHRDRKVAPPIEREHETAAGALEEDEHREHERK